MLMLVAVCQVWLWAMLKMLLTISQFEMDGFYLLLVVSFKLAIKPESCMHQVHRATQVHFNGITWSVLAVLTEHY